MPFDIQLLPRINAKLVRQDGKQYYVDADGKSFPSVTTILNATKPQEDRDRLANWKARVGTEEATRITTKASRRGTQTHKHIERYLLNQDSVCSEASLPYWESIKPVLDKIDTVRLIEGSVFNYNLNYSGKVDCVASYQGVNCICEWKTADKPKGSVERLYEYPLQLAAYLGAVSESYREYDIEVKHALLIVAIPNSPAEVFWFEALTMEEYWLIWSKRVKEYWQRLKY
jgi:PD-(D/E)XK nuclease superfamily